jgi:dipeptidyl aminopeptidase/acylaminoacyl peptidase
MRNLIVLPTSTPHYLGMAFLLIMLLVVNVFAPSAAAQGNDSPQLTVVAQALNVRDGPGVAYPAFDILMQGNEVSVIGYDVGSDWWQVQLPDGNIGWVSGGSAYVSLSGDTTGLTETVVAGPSTAAIPPATLATTAATDTAGTIVFQTVSGGPIYAVNSDGGKLRYLTTGIDPALSPDGQWVAFTRWDDTQNGALGSLWVINVDGGGERAILGEIHQPKAPTWSPDGTQIAISMQHGGRVSEERKCGTEPPPRGALDIKVKHDNGDIKFCYTLPPHPFWGLRVVDAATGEFEDLPNDLFSYSPAWDPANEWHVVYDGERGLMNLDLTRSEAATWPLTDDPNDHSPVFSPDGRLIAVSYWQHDHWEIHVLNPDGTGRVRLTETPVRVTLEQMIKGEEPQSWNNVAPTWSPDGSQIAFLTDRTRRWEVWGMSADGSNQRPLLPDEVYDQLQISFNAVDERVLSWKGQ